MVNPLPKAVPIGLLSTLLLVGLRPGWSQSVVFARNTQQKQVASANVVSRQLKDVLNELKTQYGAEIMFELRTVDGISVSPDKLNSKSTLEKNLAILLRPLVCATKK